MSNRIKQQQKGRPETLKQMAQFSPQQGSIQLFKEQIGQFVVDTFSMIRQNVSEEKSVIEGLLQALQPKVQNYHDQRQRAAWPQGTKQPQIIAQIQAAVEELNRQSESLSERLFDLSQQLLQKQLRDLEAEKQRIRQEYLCQVSQLKRQHQSQRAAAKQELSRCRLKCEVLQKCLDGLGSRENAEQGRKRQLFKYLQIIQELSLEIEMLKGGQRKDNMYLTQLQAAQSELAPPSETYTQRHHRLNHPPYDQLTYVSKSTRPPTEYYQQEYYPTSNPKTTLPATHRDISRDRRRIDSLEKAKQQAYQKYTGLGPKLLLPPKPTPYEHRQACVGAHQNRDRSSSNDRLSSGRGRPLILQTQSISMPIKLMEGPRQDMQRRSSEYLQVQQRNLRLEAVQQKLHGLKRSLSKELRNIRY